jgi:hypothetical protein
METVSADDRVRRHTADRINQEIDRDTNRDILSYGTKSRPEISDRIRELRSEWDMERLLETNAAVLALAGVALGAFVNRKWLALPAVVTGFLLQHAVQGWCPPVPALRRLGVRTRQEIDREIYALRALRGDFDDIPQNGQPERAKTVATRFSVAD